MHTARLVAVVLGLVGGLLLVGPAGATPAFVDEAAGRHDAVVLRGKAVLIAPLAAARFTIATVDDRRLQTTGFRRLHNGVFAIPLNRRTVHALDAGEDLRLSVEGLRAIDPSHPRAAGQRVRLTADLHGFDPDLDVARVDLLTTLVSAYRRTDPWLSFPDARDAVLEGLGAPGTSGDACSPSLLSLTHFHPALFLVRAVDLVGGSPSATPNIDHLIAEAVRHIAAGGALRAGLGHRSVLGGPAIDVVGGPGTDVAKDLAVSLLKAAAGKVGGEAAGWVLDTILGAGDATAEELVEIEAELGQISQQLTEVSHKLDALSDQIDQITLEIINEIDLQAYQDRASELQKEINQLCSINNQLILLSESDPTADHTAFINTLRDNIQTYVDPILRDLQTELIGTAQFEGLIRLWGRLNSDHTGYPVLFSNLYLKKATPNLDYYIGAQVIALNLLAELGHYEGGSFGQSIVDDALRRYFKGVDRQTIALAAGAALPDGSYPALVLASDDVVIDSHSGVMWQRTNFCQPYIAPDPKAGYYPPPDGDGTGQVDCFWSTGLLDPGWNPPELFPELAAFKLDGLTGWRLPTGDEATLLFSARGSQSPWDYLFDQSIYTATGSETQTGNEYWVDQMCANGLLCVVDLVGGTIHMSELWPGVPLDLSYAIAVRDPSSDETYRSICDASGQCAVPCGDQGELCPLP